VLVARMSRDVLRDADRQVGLTAPQTASTRLRRLAILSMVCWAGAVTAGRLLAYTYHRLTQAEIF